MIISNSPSFRLRLFCFFLIVLCGLGALSCHKKDPEQQVQDVLRYPQDPRAYLDPTMETQPLVPQTLQSELSIKALDQIFLPWKKLGPLYSAENTFWAVPDLSMGLSFGENKQPRDPKWIESLIAQCDMAMYPNTNVLAVTVRATDLRVMPTHKPFFRDFAQAGQGYPFDHLQAATLWPNTPIHISQTSKNGTWVLAETAAGAGWVRTDDVAVLNESMAREYQTGRYIALIRDDVTISDSQGFFRFQGRIGMILPLLQEFSEGFETLILVPDENRRAVLKNAFIDRQSAALFPLVLTQDKIATLASQFSGQTYGWGGLYGNRDCSLMVRDLFLPFGLWLPRHSSAQAKSGQVISFNETENKNKEQIILTQGVPFLTLLWKKGHVMLYIGQRDDRPVVFHAIWGLRTRNNDVEDRFVIGKTVVTTLEPGRELPFLSNPDGNLLQSLAGMTVLGGTPTALTGKPQSSPQKMGNSH